MPEIFLRVPGNTSTKQRPRFGGGRVYTPASNIVSENEIRAIWREAGEPRIEDEDAALGVEVKIVVVRPRTHYKSNGELSAEGLRNPFPAKKKPDVDNALKLVCDALNSRAYRDDVRFVRARVDRDWGKWPETTIRIYTLNEEASTRAN